MNKLLTNLSKKEQLEEKVRNLLQTIYAELKKDYSFMPDGYEKGKRVGLKHCKYAINQLLLLKKINKETVYQTAKLLEEYFYRLMEAEIQFANKKEKWLEEYSYGKNSAFLHIELKLKEISREVELNGECKKGIS